MQVRPSVTFMISEPCPCCHGIGRVEALDTCFSKIEREICRRLVSPGNICLLVVCPQCIALVDIVIGNSNIYIYMYMCGQYAENSLYNGGITPLRHGKHVQL